MKQQHSTAAHHASLPWILPYWTPESLLYCKVRSTFLPNPPHLPWVVICQTVNNCINFYVRCKFNSWVLVEPGWEESLVYTNAPNAFIQKKVSVPKRAKQKTHVACCRLLRDGQNQYLNSMFLPTGKQGGLDFCWCPPGNKHIEKRWLEKSISPLKGSLSGETC